MNPTSQNDRLIRLFKENGSRPFLITATGEQLSYAETLGAAQSGMHSLTDQGLNPGDRIGLELPNGPEFAILYLACLLGGFTAVPLNNTLPEKDRDFILRGTRLKLLLSRSTKKSAPCPIGSPPPLSPNEHQENAAYRLLEKIKPSRLLSITFTSGTTNQPKGVAHKAGTLIGNAETFNRQFSIHQKHRLLHIMPMGYMAGFLNTILSPLMAGASIVLAKEFSPASVLNFWEPAIRNGANLIWLSPTMLETLNRLDRDARGIEHCRQNQMYVFSATAPLHLETKRQFEKKYGIPVVESYGLSELLLLTANEGKKGAKDQSVGPPLSNVDIKIRNERGECLHAGQEGSIHIRTPYCSAGYLDFNTGEPITAKKDWFDTGDLGYFDGDGYLFVTGRCKDLIIRGGFNLSPRVIEEALLLHESIEDVAVIGVPHSFHGEEIAAFVLFAEGRSLRNDETAIRLHCRTMLGPTQVPDRFVETDQLPKGPTGKIKKDLLRQRMVTVVSP